MVPIDESRHQSMADERRPVVTPERPLGVQSGTHRALIEVGEHVATKHHPFRSVQIDQSSGFLETTPMKIRESQNFQIPPVSSTLGTPQDLANGWTVFDHS